MNKKKFLYEITPPGVGKVYKKIKNRFRRKSQRHSKPNNTEIEHLLNINYV